jgi:hypothetical protein
MVPLLLRDRARGGGVAVAWAHVTAPLLSLSAADALCR